MNAKMLFYTIKKIFFPVVFFPLVFYCITSTTKSLADWQSGTIASNIGVNKSTSIAVDKKDNPYICYSDTSNHYLRYATGTSTNTVKQQKPVLYDGNTIGASIAVDTNRRIHISYIGDDDNLYYTTNAYDESLFSTAAIDTSGYPGINTAIAVDTTYDPDTSLYNVNVHICYYDYFNKVLKYATNASGTWETADVETIDSLVDDADCSIAAGAISTVSGTDTVSFTSAHISYIGSLVTNYGGHTRTEARLKYATDTSGAWTTTVVHPNDSARYGASIAFGKDGTPQISYSTGDKIMYGVFKEGLWFIGQAVPKDTLKSGNYESKTSLGIDGCGNAHICYYDNKEKALMYVTNESGSWAKPKIVASNLGDGGRYNSLAVDTSGRVHISYYDANSRAVKYALKKNKSFTIKADQTELMLNLNDTGTVTVTFTGKNNCPIPDETITSTIMSGMEYISVSPKYTQTDTNGQAIFAITAKGTGTANVIFRHNKLKTKPVNVTVE